MNIKALAIGLLSVATTLTASAMEHLNVNEEVTTVITASEPIRLVDISTDKVAGDQPIENILRLKPKDGLYAEGETLGIVTIITERYRTQYTLRYTSNSFSATTDKVINLEERTPFENPEISMSRDEMREYAFRIWLSPPHYKNSAKRHKVQMRINNIYAVGDYFFIDYSLENKTNIRFEIDQLRVKLVDKKIHKATNAQMIEIPRLFSLNGQNSFRSSYRNVIVIKKLTFPDEKLLRLELSEKQISGRNISISINYKDILKADSFHPTLYPQETFYPQFSQINQD